MLNDITRDTVCVLTARSLETILAEGGAQSWRLSARNAGKCTYVVCVQNRKNKRKPKDWGDALAKHHTAFIVGRLKEVVQSQEEKCSGRWMLVFSEYAKIDIENAWPGHQNPVFYTSLQNIGIDVKNLNFQLMLVEK